MSGNGESQLFTVRLWAERVAETDFEFRGRVVHVATGEIHYFRDWSKLTLFLQEEMNKCCELQNPSGSAEEGDDLEFSTA